MNRRQYAIALLFSISLLAVALVPLSSQQGSSYNPWLDYNDDGIIDAHDLQALGQAYGYSGTPLSVPMAQAYDSGWIDIHDKQGQYFNITPGLNLETSTWTPRIYGKVKADTPPHQKYWYGYGVPGWNKTYGGPYVDGNARSVVQTNDGGYAIAGTAFNQSPPFTYQDFWLYKTDSAGTVEWSNKYFWNWEDYDYCNSMVETSDGGYALAGSTTFPDPFNPVFHYTKSLLVKTDSAGTEQWVQSYGSPIMEDGEVARSVVQTNDGGYALAGATNSYGLGAPTYSNFWLVKIDSAGTMQWNRTYGGTNNDCAFSVVQTGDGGYALAGVTQSYGAGLNDFYLVKTDSSGNMQWNKTYGGTSDDYAYSVVHTVGGGYAIAGYTYSYGAGSRDFWLVKTDSSGTMLWSKTYGGTSDDYAQSVVQTGDGGYALAGSTYSYGVACDFWLVKTDSSGNLQWSKTYGGSSFDLAYSIIQTSDGGYALAGEAASYGDDFWLVKTDAYGLTEDIGVGLAMTGYTADTITLYRGKIDPYWNYVRVRIWVAKENP